MDCSQRSLCNSFVSFFLTSPTPVIGIVFLALVLVLMHQYLKRLRSSKTKVIDTVKAQDAMERKLAALKAKQRQKIVQSRNFHDHRNEQSSSDQPSSSHRFHDDSDGHNSDAREHRADRESHRSDRDKEAHKGYKDNDARAHRGLTSIIL